MKDVRCIDKVGTHLMLRLVRNMYGVRYSSKGCDSSREENPRKGKNKKPRVAEPTHKIIYHTKYPSLHNKYTNISFPNIPVRDDLTVRTPNRIRKVPRSNPPQGVGKRLLAISGDLDSSVEELGIGQKS